MALSARIRVFKIAAKLSYPNCHSRKAKSYWHCESDKHLIHETKYAQLLKSASLKGDQVAIQSYHQNITKTYSEYLKDVDSLAAGLLSLHHCTPGSLVAVLSPNVYEWTVAQFACSKIGCAQVNINPALQPPELEHALNQSRSKVLVVGLEHSTVDFYSLLRVLAPELDSAEQNDLRLDRLPYLRSIVVIGDERKPATISYQEVISNATKELHQKADEIHDSVDPDSVVNVQFTSGTTGKQKAVALTNHGLVNNAYSFGNRVGLHAPNSKVLINLPLVHTFGCVCGVLSSVIHGASAVLPAARFNAQRSVEALAKYKCSIIYGTPTMYIDMLARMPEKAMYPSLRSGVIGGASVPQQLLNKIQQRLKIRMLPAYGATEMSPVATVATRMEGGRLLETALDHIELKIVDSKGKIVPFGEKGELCSRGYHIFKEYLHQPDKTEEVVRDGWYYTGDEAIMSPDGHVAITGRAKDMIIRGGENVYPAEIEDFLLGLEEVEEAHVFGVPDQRLGEEVAVWVKTKPGIAVSEERLKAACKGKISHFKIPRYVKFVETFPKTHSGKIQKFILRKEMTEELNLGRD
ncbi:acyl-CoA synthetase family member 2, mitochondrial [Galendromus occidentalis]|uniref:Medium-chain acyl-CoA ligase ACSF2, mitochondrial n=1 Tax=Galendromus occidentalis TaxID=34638 RepID=A0AAJ7L5L2_9ACAR|nr:acyl-CoA synthetase family member 2, mitochondrial [Galendromus occidentalis]